MQSGFYETVDSFTYGHKVDVEERDVRLLGELAFAVLPAENVEGAVCDQHVDRLQFSVGVTQSAGEHLKQDALKCTDSITYNKLCCVDHGFLQDNRL